jgi:hypothetical protein
VRVRYEFPPVGGFPPTLEQAGITLAVLQNWKLENGKRLFSVHRQLPFPHPPFSNFQFPVSIF